MNLNSILISQGIYAFLQSINNVFITVWSRSKDFDANKP